MRDARNAEAEAAWDTLSPVEQQQAFALLCESRPEAVLQAVVNLRRHQAVLRDLLRQEPPPGHGMAYGPS